MDWDDFLEVVGWAVVVMAIAFGAFCTVLGAIKMIDVFWPGAPKHPCLSQHQEKGEGQYGETKVVTVCDKYDMTKTT